MKNQFASTAETMKVFVLGNIGRLVYRISTAQATKAGSATMAGATFKESVQTAKEGVAAATGRFQRFFNEKLGSNPVKAMQSKVEADSDKASIAVGTVSALAAAMMTSSLVGSVIVGGVSAAILEYIRNRKKNGAIKKALMAGIVGAVAPAAFVYIGMLALMLAGLVFKIATFAWGAVAACIVA